MHIVNNCNILFVIKKSILIYYRGKLIAYTNLKNAENYQKENFAQVPKFDSFKEFCYNTTTKYQVLKISFDKHLNISNKVRNNKMPSIRQPRHTATATSVKNIKLYGKMSVLYRKLLQNYGRGNLFLWREVNKRKYLGTPKFQEEIEKGEKALPKDLVNTLNEKLTSKRSMCMFLNVVDKNLKVRKFYSMNKTIEKASKIK